MIRAKERASFSEWIEASVFGVISPKRRIIKVRKPVAIPTKVFPKTSMVNVVMMADAAMFTMLLPIRMVLSIFPESAITFSRTRAFLLPCSTKDWIRIRLTVVRAVSAEEKKAERSTMMTTAPACIGTLESKVKVTPFVNNIYKNIQYMNLNCKGNQNEMILTLLREEKYIFLSKTEKTLLQNIYKMINICYSDMAIK